jgi:hypothetical protein
VAIEKIALDESGLLCVQPGKSRFPDYRFIWRSATSVRWDDESRALYALPIKEFSPTDYLLQIVPAVQSEYGVTLTIQKETNFVGMSEELIAALHAAHP